MESMRSLDKSLPSSQPNRQAPPEQLLQAFRTAALSVTNLYKSAVTDQAESRRAGYQDALEDLLKFLDQENLGVQDGEGWRVRQWATQLYDGEGYQQQSDMGDEQSERDTRPQTTTPVSTEENVVADASIRQEDTLTAEEHIHHDDNILPMYHFHGNSHAEPEMQTDEPSSPQPVGIPPSSSPSAPVQVEVLSRNHRSTSRPHATRHNTRAFQRDFTFNSGSKRKIQFPDFFDISNLHDKRDSSGGASGTKRGRYV